MAVWEDAHAGSVVLGHDGTTYRVVEFVRDPRGPIVTLQSLATGARVGPAQPPPGTPITIMQQADMDAEARAFATLADAGLGPELLRETA